MGCLRQGRQERQTGLPQSADTKGRSSGRVRSQGRREHLVEVLALSSAWLSTSTLIRCIVSWPMGALKTPGFHSKGLVHKVISFEDGPYPLRGFDDEVGPSMRMPLPHVEPLCAGRVQYSMFESMGQSMCVWCLFALC